MRKITALLTALVLLLTAGAFSEAAEVSPQAADLLDLYGITAEGEKWLGTAIPVLEGAAVTSPAVLTEEFESLKIYDGAAWWDVWTAQGAASGKLLVILYGTEQETSQAPVYIFADPGMPGTAGMTVRSGDWMRSRINRAVYGAGEIKWQEMDALVLTLSGDTEPGAAVLTAEGKLAGMVAAEYAEGVNRFVALTSMEIINAIQEVAARLNRNDTMDSRPEGYRVELDNNLVTFDWTDVQLPELQEGNSLYHIVADADSNYLTYTEIVGDQKSVTALLAPGRMYVSGLVTCPSDQVPEELPAEYAITVLPEAEPLTEHSFKPILLAIAEKDPGSEGAPVVPEKMTEELLRSDRVFLYSVSGYDVSESMSGFTLLVTLTAPDGSNYCYESGWYYDPSIGERDEWYTPMKDTGLLTMLNETGYPEGEYTLNMYIDGKLAGTGSFTLNP